MSGSLAIPILVAIGVLAGIAAFFQLSNSRGTRHRGRRRVSEEQRSGNNAATQRKTDARVLSGNEKRLYVQAKTLLSEGKVQAGARILEQLHMHRESIQSLEDAGLIHEAAKILMRMGKHNRAGVVYARHGLWLDAAASFKMAQMPLEVAKCAREGGRFELAGEFFEKAGRFDDAAECYEKLGDFRRAARHFFSAGNRPRAMQLYEKFAVKPGADIDLLESDEVKAIIEHLSEGKADSGLAIVAVRHNRIPEVVAQLIGHGFDSKARELYQLATGDIGPQLMASVNYHDKSAETLAQLFLSVSHFQYAGMVFERMTSFERAGAAFEQAEDYERSAYCYERAGRDDKANPMRAKAENAASPSKRGGQANAGFALANLPSDPRSSSFAQSDGDSTAVVDTTPAPPQQPVADKPSTRMPTVAPTFSLSSDSEDEQRPAPTLAPAPPLRVLQNDTAPAASEPAAGPNLTAPDSLAVISLAQPRPPFTAPSPAINDTPVTFEHAHPAFARAKFLSDLDSEQKNALWSIGHTVDFAEGDTILTYDDEPQGVYVIVDGAIACYRNVSGTETYVDQMGASETFGELWLLADQPTAVRFVAQTQTQIRIVGRDAFNELMDKDGTLARKVYKRFTLRLLKRLLRPQNNSTNLQAS